MQASKQAITTLKEDILGIVVVAVVCFGGLFLQFLSIARCTSSKA
jgi:hypothetical protein